MPVYRNTLPAGDRPVSLKILRTPTAGGIRGVVTSDGLLVIDTHYWGGRTGPCERTVNAAGQTMDDTNCPACQNKIGWRPHVYVAAIMNPTGERFLFECTTLAAEQFEHYIKTYGTLRGAAFLASRPKGKPNSVINLQCTPAKLNNMQLPDAPDICAALAILWTLPKAAFTAKPTTDVADALVIDPLPMKLMRTPPDNAGNPPPTPIVESPTLPDLHNGANMRLINALARLRAGKNHAC